MKRHYFYYFLTVSIAFFIVGAFILAIGRVTTVLSQVGYVPQSWSTYQVFDHNVECNKVNSTTYEHQPMSPDSQGWFNLDEYMEGRDPIELNLHVCVYAPVGVTYTVSWDAFARGFGFGVVDKLDAFYVSGQVQLFEYVSRTYTCDLVMLSAYETTLVHRYSENAPGEWRFSAYVRNSGCYQCPSSPDCGNYNEAQDSIRVTEFGSVEPTPTPLPTPLPTAVVVTPFPVPDNPITNVTPLTVSDGTTGISVTLGISDCVSMVPHFGGYEISGLIGDILEFFGLPTVIPAIRGVQVCLIPVGIEINFLGGLMPVSSLLTLSTWVIAVPILRRSRK